MVNFLSIASLVAFAFAFAFAVANNPQDWIADGEKRNSYIPSDPEKYYTRTGSWEGWEEFLGVRDS